MEGQKTRRRVRCKLHLTVDPATHDIVAVEVSLENVHDAEAQPTGRDGDVSVQAVDDGQNQSATYNAQVEDMTVYVSAINKLNSLGLPVTNQSVTATWGREICVF